ncbi:MAG: protein kinase [Pirellulales bacterium]|nr:protein kinase [Pirellulales bacterium]
MATTASRTVLGYGLIERIGSGGCGEVWKAEAPGGISKAVKIIYGRFDGDRASRELAALNRIKEVRHPFLLSLERIEVVDGQLVIVTELADMCLKDRFDACRRSGRPGIPRDELLRELWDAAEVLDYLCENHSLQHLDIKPENLLLVAGRIKVADFGLVKQLSQPNVSLIGGLTPTYSAPELFDGYPSRWSDQYSLAIVYCQMLTGALPFDGTTPARLAVQHLQASPCLSDLPPCDRPAIGKALSKNPSQRFPNCRQLIDQLTVSDAPPPDQRAKRSRPSRRSPAVPAGPRNPAVRPAASPMTPRGATVGEEPVVATSPNTIVVDKVGFPRPLEVGAVQFGSESELPTLRPLDLPATEAVLRPTLLVGVGGTGTEVLRQVARRMFRHFGDPAKTRAVHYLLVDTDVGSLAAARSDEPSAMDTAAMLALPLRRVQEYRLRPPGVVQWLDRRWLYNIPRSLETGGLRPLGRLAFVDHAAKVLEHLDAGLRQVMDAGNIEATARCFKVPMASDFPRIFVVASISGGTGSGMVIDMGYAVRTALAELGLPQSAVYGVLVHSTGSRVEEKALASANAYACLCELNHFERPDTRYPGNPDCGLPAMPGNVGPFQAAYLVHLGNDLDDDRFRTGTDSVAEYLYLNAASMAGALLDKSRTAAGGNVHAGTASLRTFGAAVLADLRGDVASAAGGLVSAAVARHWLGNEFAPECRADTAASREGSRIAPASFDEMFSRTFGAGASRLFVHRLRELLAEYQSRSAATAPSEEPAVAAQARFAHAVRQLETLRQSFERKIGAADGDCLSGSEPCRPRIVGCAAAVRRAFVDAVRPRVLELAAEVDGQLLPALFAHSAELHAVLEGGGDLALFFEDALGYASHAAAVRALAGVDPLGALFNGRSTREVSSLLEDCLSAVSAAHAGRQRLIVLVPEARNAEQVRGLLPAGQQNSATILSDRGAVWAVVCESEPLPLASVASRLIGRPAEYATAASRLHARIDVAWHSLGETP